MWLINELIGGLISWFFVFVVAPNWKVRLKLHTQLNKGTIQAKIQKASEGCDSSKMTRLLVASSRVFRGIIVPHQSVVLCRGSKLKQHSSPVGRHWETRPTIPPLGPGGSGTDCLGKSLEVWAQSAVRRERGSHWTPDVGRHFIPGAAVWSYSTSQFSLEWPYNSLTKKLATHVHQGDLWSSHAIMLPGNYASLLHFPLLIGNNLMNLLGLKSWHYKWLK